MIRFQRTRLLLPIAGACALAGAACGPTPGEQRLDDPEAPPAAAMLAPGQSAETLDDQLARLRAELDAGMEGDPARLLQAEAITDGLMEARRPFDWLGAGYDLEARLRQLQAMADRVVAQLRRGAALADVAEDVETMTRALVDLRGQLAAGSGGPAPPTLDSLLAQDPMENARVGRRAVGAAAPAPAGAEAPETANEPDQPAAAPATGPLGQPVRPDSAG